MRLLQVVNTQASPATDGGTSRNLALNAFVDSQGGIRIAVQDDAWRASRARRQMRPVSLTAEIRRLRPDVLVFRYPGFPFFWSLDRDLDLLRSLAFLGMLRAALAGSGCRMVIDLCDLIRFPSPDTGITLHLNDRLLAAFERRFFGSADEIWACSEGFGRHIADTYGVAWRSFRLALNGNFRECGDAPAPPEEAVEGSFRFFYAGDLGRGWRGVETMLDGFVSEVSDPSARLVLCGANGGWIAGHYSDRRIVYLGKLTSMEASAIGRQCHVALIPQPEHQYFHLSFPTKLGFYMTLGLPVITTPLREPARFVEKHGVGLAAPPEEFGRQMRRLVELRHEVEAFCSAAVGLSESFYWDSIYGAAFEGFRERFGVAGSL